MKRFKLLSIFSGAGGLDIGFERAGFHTQVMCEVEPMFVKTLRANAGRQSCDGNVYFRQVRILDSDIRDVSADALSDCHGIDCLIGGPPCQAFSSSGKQLSILDERGSLVGEFVRLVDELRPKAFVFENVRGIVTARDEAGRPGGVIRRVYAGLEAVGYSCRAALLNSADYGSYQRRVRCFILGVRHGVAPDIPEPTHSAVASGLFGQQPWRTLREFLSCQCDGDEANFTFPTRKLALELDRLPEGSGLKSAGVAEPTRPGGHWGYRQGTFIADLSMPARTVTGSASQDWVRWQGQLRRLTLLEVQRLQGFPDDWIFHGSKAQVYKQVGNAVPTRFGEVLGSTLLDYLSRMDCSRAAHPIEFPRSFEDYIDYTRRDGERNGSSRKVHLAFGASAAPHGAEAGNIMDKQERFGF